VTPFFPFHRIKGLSNIDGMSVYYNSVNILASYTQVTVAVYS